MIGVTIRIIMYHYQTCYFLQDCFSEGNQIKFKLFTFLKFMLNLCTKLLINC